MGLSMTLAEYRDPVAHRVFVQTGVRNPWMKIAPERARVAEYDRRGPKWTGGGIEGLSYMSDDQITILKAIVAISKKVGSGAGTLLTRIDEVSATMRGKTARDKEIMALAASVTTLPRKVAAYSKRIGVSRAKALVA